MNFLVASGLLTILCTAFVVQGAWVRAARRVYVFKPLTLLLVVAGALYQFSGSSVAWLVLAGLCCSLVGDVLLMLPRDRFTAGLVAFLSAHLLYIAAFVLWLAPHVPHAFMAWFPPAPVFLGIFAVVAFYGRLGKMRLPVLAYASVILTMLWLAAVLSRSQGTAVASAVYVGATLFVFSDLALAYERFVKPVRFSPLLVLGTYFPAQWCLALACMDAGALPFR